MKDTFKYITPGKEDKLWGIYLNVIGTKRILPENEYPPIEHPSGYYFNWDKGRILHEFQINFIIEGSGVLETNDGLFQVKAGSVMLIYPGMWHRYRPNSKTGWVENYIGIEGEAVDRFLSNPILTPKNPVVFCGLKESLLDTFYSIFELCEKEKPGFQQIASGYTVKLLGTIISIVKNKDFKGKNIEITIEKSKFLIRQNLDKGVDVKEMANSLNIGYSYFRKMFKLFTGVSPGQYQLQLRILRAKELLLTSGKTVKEIAYDTGFDSIYYFSRIFKDKTGKSPSEFRNE